MLTIVLALLAAAANAVSSVLQRKANLREVESERSPLAGLVDLLRQPLWLAGIGAVIAGFLLQAAALDAGELSEVQPLMALELPMTLLLASRVFRRPLRGRTWVDIAVMTVGMTVFLFCLAPSKGAPAAASGQAWAWAAGATGGAVVVLGVTGLLTRGPSRAAAFGTGAGISFALTATFMSGALAPGLSSGLFGRWQTYLVVVAGLTAMLLLQGGMRAGTLLVVQPGVTLIDPVVAVVLGVLLFHERVRTGGWIVGEVVGAAAVAWGVFCLSRSPVVDESDDRESGTGTPHGEAAEPAGAPTAERS